MPLCESGVPTDKWHAWWVRVCVCAVLPVMCASTINYEKELPLAQGIHFG